MKVTVRIIKLYNSTTIIFKLHNRHNEIIEHQQSNMFSYPDYYEKLINHKIIEDNKTYTVDKEFIDKLQNAKKKLSYDNIFTTNENFESISTVNIHTVLSTDCILHNKKTNKEYNCVFVRSECCAAQDYCEGISVECRLTCLNISLNYVDFLQIGNNIYSYNFLKNIIPCCIDIVDNTNKCYFINYTNLKSRVSNYYEGNVTRYFIYYNTYPEPWKDINYLAQTIDKIYNLCNNKQIVNENEILPFIRTNIYLYFYNRINKLLPIIPTPFLRKNFDYMLDFYRQIRQFSEEQLKTTSPKFPDYVYFMSLKEDLMQAVYHPKRLVYYMSRYNYCINEETYLD